MLAWDNLSVEEKHRHKFQRCQECLTLTHGFVYGMLRKNQSAFPGKYAVPAAPDAAPDAAPVLNQMVDKENLIERTLNMISEVTVPSIHTTALAHDISMRTLQNVRAKAALESCATNRPLYELKPENYIFDRDVARHTITAISEGDNKLNFAQLARDIPVYLSNGKLASNGNQILKQFAINDGLLEKPDEEKRKDRRGKRMLELDGVKFSITALYPTKDQIAQQTRDKIARGELDIGVPIVPITLECLKINEKGELELQSITTHGRAFGLQRILDKLLRQHEEFGLHRQPYEENGDINAIKYQLRERGKCGQNGKSVF